MIKIVIVSYRELTNLLNKLNYKPPADVSISVVEALMSDAVARAKQIEEDGQVDVFISAGGNAGFLSNHIKTPLVVIPVTVVGILQALSKKKHKADITSVITYKHKLSYLEQIIPVLNRKIKQIQYSHMDELPKIMDGLSCR